jgi:hypothetical protein
VSWYNSIMNTTNKFPLVLILIAVVLALVIGIGAYYLGIQQQKMSIENSDLIGNYAESEDVIYSYENQSTASKYFRVQFAYPKGDNIDTATNNTADNFAHSTVINFYDGDHPRRSSHKGFVSIQEKDFPVGFCDDEQARSSLFKTNSSNIICLQDNLPQVFRFSSDSRVISAFEKNIDPRNQNVNYNHEKNEITTVMLLGRFVVSITLSADTPEEGNIALLKFLETFSFAPFFSQ